MIVHIKNPCMFIRGVLLIKKIVTRLTTCMISSFLLFLQLFFFLSSLVFGKSRYLRIG